MNHTNTFSYKQILLLCTVGILLLVVIKSVYSFIPGFLGAIAVYVVSRSYYFQMVYHYKWRKGITAFLFVLVLALLIAFSLIVIYNLVFEQIRPLIENPSILVEKLRTSLSDIQSSTGILFFTNDVLNEIQQQVTTVIPLLINDTVHIIMNLAILLFTVYFMYVHGAELEQRLRDALPFHEQNTHHFIAESKRLIKVGVLGIPLISLVQGITATLGYMIFGVEEYILWGFLTGLFAFFPIIGTMIIYVPLVIYMYITKDHSQAVLLGLYSMIVTGNIDYVFRITFLKKIGHVHPIITVIGVIAGLNLFGFIGLIFGPLIVSYIVLLVKIYSNEFPSKKLIV